MTASRMLEGQRGLVTGASSGIGRAIALALGAAGARVAVNYHSNPASAVLFVDGGMKLYPAFREGG